MIFTRLILTAVTTSFLLTYPACSSEEGFRDYLSQKIDEFSQKVQQKTIPPFDPEKYEVDIKEELRERGDVETTIANMASERREERQAQKVLSLNLQLSV